MKKILIQTIFLSFCLLSGVTYGQSGTLYLASAMGVDNIVRYDPTTGKHVIYSTVTGSENHFSLTDMNILIDVKVADNLKVRDFEIIDGLVFFCGESSGGSGFLGWFDINDLFYAGGTAQIDQTLSALGLLTLDNIEVYHDTTGAIRIAGYGVYSYYALNVTLYRAFEAVGTPVAGMQYRTMDLWCAGPFADIADLTVTDNFVVYLSRERNQLCVPNLGIGISLHPLPKYDMFGTLPYYYHSFQFTSISPLFSYGYVVPINDDPYHEVMPKIVHSTGDEVAVCTYRKDLDESGLIPPLPPCVSAYTPPINAYITLYEFDLTALVPSINNVVPMTSRAIAQLNNDIVISLDGLVYESQTHRYIILHRHETSVGVDEHAVTTANYLSGVPTFFESSYQTTFNTSSMWMPTNICVDGYLNYTVVGYDMVSMEYIFWRNSAATVAGNCDRMVQYPVVSLPLEDEKCYACNVKPTTWTPLLFYGLGNERAEYPCIKICD